MKPDNYLVWAILTTIFCCLPFGIVSIVHAAKVDGAWYAGQTGEAMRRSAEAKKWATWAAISGLIIAALWFLFVIGTAADQGY
jgi:hypothetical protein